MTANFYFSLIAFVISIASGAYFLWKWLATGKQRAFLLYWAFGLGSLLSFKIPNILANAAVIINQEDFYPFFFFALLANFLAYFALILGLETLAPPYVRKSSRAILGFWFGIAATYFAFGFLIPGFGVDMAPAWVGHILFYIPAQVLLLHELKSVPVAKRSAKLMVTLGTLSLLLTSIIYILVQVGPYPPEFWYFSVISSNEISILQIFSGLLLFFGFRAVALSYLRSESITASKP